MRTPQQAMKEAIESGAVQAWIEGKGIQMKGNGEPWGPFAGAWPAFAIPLFYWRPAPAPTLRPWKPDEVPVGAQVRYATNPKSCRMLITSNIDPHLLGEVKRWTYMDLFKSMEHSTDGGKTWKPCGVLEGGE